MSEPAAFYVDRGSLRVASALCALVAIGCVALAAVPGGLLGQLVSLAFSVLSAYLFFHCIVIARDRRAVLTIGPGGIVYRWFSPQTIPWTDITAITAVRYYRYGKLLGDNGIARGALVSGQSEVHIPRQDTINFAVADFSRFPNGPGRTLTRAIQSAAGLPPIAIQVGALSASSDDITAALRRHWQGEIAQRDIKSRAR